MKTKIVYLIFLFSLATNLFAQTNVLAESNNGTKEKMTRKSAISIQTGMVFPIGDMQYLNTSMPELDEARGGTFINNNLHKTLSLLNLGIGAKFSF
jgi:hypothetical protein